MKQIIQDLKSGNTILEEVPVPNLKSGHLLIKTHRTLVSLGTEKMLVDFGKANYIQKARQQPEKVKMVLNKIKSDGLRPTLDAVFRKLGEPLPLGYCNAGEVVAVGNGVKEFAIGDRVVSNGQHAEVVCIPENLVAKIPDGVSYEDAAFTVIGAIGLQGIRLINPTFGETVVVTGLGLIGLISTQILIANGCKVIGLDFDPVKVALAKSWGVDAYNAADSDVVATVESLTNSIGADAVLITASTKSNDVISEAAQMSRKRGRIVLVGVIGLEMQRSDFYEKELSFQVSCSYGPGRYDSNYEDKGMDYPIGLVRWTEKRNFQAILSAIQSGSIKVQPLITERVALDRYQEIYGDMSKKGSIASIMKYSTEVNVNQNNVELISNSSSPSKGQIGIIGAGNFTSAMIVPMLSKLKANLRYIASSKGLSSTTLAKKYKISNSTTDANVIFEDNNVDAVIITTRHNQHESQVIKGIQSGKHVFVEKPLAITYDGLDRILTEYQKSDKSLTVGFNRRFSPFTQEAKKLIGNDGHSINVIATMNAGAIPSDHWVQDIEVGGGRIIGEACHYIDLITFLTGSLVEEVIVNAQGIHPQSDTDNMSILLKYKNGSQGVINYFSDGHKSYAKERIEIFDQGKNIVIDNFRKSEYFGYKSSGMKKTQDKGHYNQFNKWNDMITNGGDAIIPIEEIMNTSKASIACIESLTSRQWVKI
tara:strand:+ start:16413 stop:18527 length:2115 start_codon:yes stop_codon:yes gene_type:complete